MVKAVNYVGKKVDTIVIGIVSMDTIAMVKVVEDPASTKTDEVVAITAAGTEVVTVDMEVAEAIRSANTEMTALAREATMTSQDITTEIEPTEEVTSITKIRAVTVALVVIERIVATEATERTVAMGAIRTIEGIEVIGDMAVVAISEETGVASSTSSLLTSLTKTKSIPTQTIGFTIKTIQLSLPR